MLLATWTNWWDDWLLYHKVTIDGPTRRIYINPDVASLDVKADIYSAWKRWMRIRDHAKYLPAFRTTGGDPVGDGLYSGDIYFLINNWQIIVDHPVSVRGIIYHDDPISPFVIMGGGGVTSVVSNLAYSYTATGGGTTVGEADWTELERAQIRQRLGIDGVKVTATSTGTLTTIASDVWDATLIDHVTPGSVGEALAQTKAAAEGSTVSVVTVTNMVEELLKYDRNRTKIDVVTKQLTIYDNDGVTPIRVFNLRDRNGVPSVVESMERIPVV